MAEDKEATVTLIAHNGVTVSVAESKVAERLHGGYRLPDQPAESKRPSRSRSKK